MNKKIQDTLEWMLVIIISLPLFIFISILIGMIYLIDFIEERIKQ